MDDAEVSLEGYDKLSSNIPSIGFLSQKKRAIAYLKVTKLAQQMIDAGDISEDNALFLLSMLVRKDKSFQKAAMTASLRLADIDRKIISSVGFTYANNMRCNLQMHPVDNNSTLQP